MARFDGHVPSAGHDTAGTPWAGRRLSGTGFEHDTGEGDPALLAALAAAATQRAGAAQERTLLQVLAASRLLVPVVAVPGEVDASSGLPADVSSDMAAITLVAPDGRRALPAFTGLAALHRWDPSARPVPVPASRAAEAAVQEGCQVIVLDVGAPRSSLPSGYALRPSMVWALAMRRPWLPAHEDPHVRTAVTRAVSAETEVTGHRLDDGGGGALRITVALRPGLDRQAVHELVRRIGERVAADGETRARIDALAFTVRPDQPHP